MSNKLNQEASAAELIIAFCPNISWIVSLLELNIILLEEYVLTNIKYETQSHCKFVVFLCLSVTCTLLSTYIHTA